jgi:hypothetical protein
MHRKMRKYISQQFGISVAIKRPHCEAAGESGFRETTLDFLAAMFLIYMLPLERIVVRSYYNHQPLRIILYFLTWFAMLYNVTETVYTLIEYIIKYTILETKSANISYKWS